MKSALALLALIVQLTCPPLGWGAGDESAPPQSPQKPPKPATVTKLNLCTFNVQFLGASKLRDNAALADYLKKSNCDLVTVQELIAPPDLTKIPGNKYYKSKEVPKFPDGSEMRPNELSTLFFEKMIAAGFNRYWLSEEDTGVSPTNHSNGTNTEYYVTFYKSSRLRSTLAIPNGFLDADRTQNPNWDRVPYAFSFKSSNNKFDFVLISVHLHPGPGTRDRQRRKIELSAIYKWINDQSLKTTERDFIILGDMNLEDKKELDDNLVPGFKSLNTDAGFMTNTNLNSPKPYDHVILQSTLTKEVSSENNFQVLNLIEGMKTYWTLDPANYPGSPNYNHNLFRFYYTDHHPVLFRAEFSGRDDD